MKPFMIVVLFLALACNSEKGGKAADSETEPAPTAAEKAPETPATKAAAPQGDPPATGEARDVGEFRGIALSGDGDIELTQGTPISVEIDADDELLRHIVTEVRDGVLHIHCKGTATKGKNVVVNTTGSNAKVTIDGKEVASGGGKCRGFDAKITMPVVDSLAIAGSGDIKGTAPIKSEALELSSSGRGDFELELAAKKLSISVTGGGDYALKGTTDELVADRTGQGDIKSPGLEAVKASVKITGSGDVEMAVVKELSANITGGGDIVYIGDPKVTKNITGGGSVRKR